MIRFIIILTSLLVITNPVLAEDSNNFKAIIGLIIAIPVIIFAVYFRVTPMHLIERFGKTTNKAIDTVGNAIKKEIKSKKINSESKKENTEIKNWFSKNLENFKDPTSIKTKSPNEKKQQEPKKEDQKPKEVTITSQEEESIYEQVAKELKENRSEGVWLKAYTENDGDETKTKIAYTKKRVASLMEELKIKKQT